NNMRISATGVYHVPKVSAPTTITVKATSAVNPVIFGTATVEIRPGRHLEIVPQASSAFTAQQIPFRVLAGDKDSDVTWTLSKPTVGNISEKGVLTVNSSVSQTEPIQVTATSKGMPGEIRAAATVIVNAPFAQVSGNMRLLLFVIVMGALGSMLYYASSFVSY